jgi:hypothetical protein
MQLYLCVTLVPQALIYLQWVRYAIEVVLIGRPYVVLNMDETSLSSVEDQGKGMRTCRRAARGAQTVRRGDVAPEPSPPLSITGVGPDASAARRDERERVADAGAGYAEPTTWLDGGVLSPGQGLLVVPGARAGSPRVEVVIEHVGRFTAPAVVPLPEQVYRMRFETGRIRSTQFATVRQGWALIRSAPSEQ